MKFACDRCGKRYVSAETPQPGRTYRVRCRCGHEIVIRGAEAVATSPAPSAEPPSLPPPPVPVPPQLPAEEVAPVLDDSAARAAPATALAAPPVPEPSGSRRIPGTIPVPRGQLNLGAQSSPGAPIGLIVASLLIASALVGGVVVLRSASEPPAPAPQAPAATSGAAPAPQAAPAPAASPAATQPAPQTAQAPHTRR